VPENLLKDVLNAARLAPTANNSQPWRIIVVKDEDAKLKLAAAANGQRFMAQAPLVLVACGVPDEAFPTVGG
jgi:nitroreductase